jgi:hypothetical protein
MADLSYTDLGDYCEIPDAYIAEAGQTYVNTQISLLRSSIYDRLRRQYDVSAMVATEPLTVKKWIAALVLPKLYRKRGVDPTDLQFQEFVKAAEYTDKQVDLAANARDGLYDLPLADGTAAKKRMVVKGTSFSDPAMFKRIQADRADCERLAYERFRLRTYRY